MGKDSKNGPASGGLRGLVLGVEDNSERRSRAVEPLEDQFPLVAQALAGLPKSDHDEEVPPGTITFWLDGSTMKFTYSVKSVGITYFGVVADVMSPWRSVNDAILLGALSRKRHSGQSNSVAELDKLGKIY